MREEARAIADLIEREGFGIQKEGGNGGSREKKLKKEEEEEGWKRRRKLRAGPYV